MADKRKETQKLKHLKDKDKRATEPSMNLEIPEAHDIEEEALEVVEVVDDDEETPMVVAAADDDAEEVLEAVEVVDDEEVVVAAESGSDIAAVELVEEVKEEDINWDEAATVPPAKPSKADAEADVEVVEIIEEAEDLDDLHKTVTPGAPGDEDISAEGGSEVNLGKPTVAADEGASSIITQAHESDVGVGKTKREELASESDIDLEELLRDNVESSTVDLGGSGEHAAMPASSASKSKHPSSEKGEEVEGEIVSAEDGDDAADIISEDVLLDSRSSDIVSGDDDEELVTPKRKHNPEEVESLGEVEEVVESASPEEFEPVGEVEEVVKPVPAPKKGRGGKNERELVGAGGGRRGGFMPFILGGFLTTMLLGGGGVAAWYLNMLPESPTAEKKPAPRTFTPSPFVKGTPSPIGKSGDDLEKLKKEKDKAVAQFTALKNVLVQANIPEQPDKLKAHVDNLVEEKAASDKKLAEVNSALAKVGIKDGDVKAIAKLAAGGGAGAAKERDALAQQLKAAEKERDAAVEQRGTLEKENQTLAKTAESAVKDGAAAVKERDELKSTVDMAMKELEKARASGQSPLGSSLNGLLGAFTGMTKAPGEMLKGAVDTAKLNADLAAAKAQNIFAETPEHRLDTMLILLNSRAITDAKELESFKRYIDWVRSKDSKASPEARAKALYAEAILLRNQDNFAAARQTLGQAVKEAIALKDAVVLQKAAAQLFNDLNDPAAYYLPRVERKIADGNLKAAAEEMNAALKALPENPQLAAEALYLTGRIHEQNGDLAKAQQSYHQSLKMSGDGPTAERCRIALARLLLRTAGSSEEEEFQNDADENDEESLTEVAFEDQAGGDGGDSANRKKLEESIAIARDLIARSTDKKTQGEGYMLLGAAQSRLGTPTEGLKNFVKGLRLVNPDWSTEELDRIISNHPAFQQPEVASQPNPQMSERHFGRGLDFFWARKYADAEVEFVKAVTFYGDDARYFYFLAMSRHLQGTANKMKLANTDFERGVQLEMARPTRATEINASLERVQGDLRRLLNSYRERAQRP